jgi:NADH dehydrogenase (ubiquinone) 1 alpha subcomplex subunit 5
MMRSMIIFHRNGSGEALEVDMRGWPMFGQPLIGPSVRTLALYRQELVLTSQIEDCCRAILIDSPPLSSVIMRGTFRLLANIKSARYLEPGTPTGLTGLFTHSAPRSTLIYLYSSTLDKLKEFPESSVYRQSTEALTKHRLNIVSSVVPEGYEEWSARAKKIVAEHPEVFNTPKGGVDFDSGRHLKEVKGGKTFVTSRIDKEHDDYVDEWDGEKDVGPGLEGTRSTEERKGQQILGMKRPGEDEKTVEWEPEPLLTIDQCVPLWYMQFIN